MQWDLFALNKNDELSSGLFIHFDFYCHFHLEVV